MEIVSFAAEKSASVKPDDDGVKLLAVFRLWNAFAYYSPYLSLTDGNWDDAPAGRASTPCWGRRTSVPMSWPWAR